MKKRKQNPTLLMQLKKLFTKIRKEQILVIKYKNLIIII